MGADLILVWANAPFVGPYSDREYPEAYLLEATAKRLGALSDDAVRTAAEDAGLLSFDGDPDLDPTTDDLREQAAAAAAFMIGSLCGSVYSRNMVLFFIDNRWRFIGGGESWGDTPEDFDTVAFVSNLGIFDEPLPAQTL